MEHDATRSARADAAAVALREAVEAMPAGVPSFGEATVRQFWEEYGRASITWWVTDLERDLHRVASALDATDSAPVGDDSVAMLEEALWRADAAREKLEAVFCRCFAVPSLTKHGKGVRFEPDTKAMLARLRGLAAEHGSAREIIRLGRKIARHPATTLRNQLSHSLASIGEAREVTFVQIAQIDDGSILAWELRGIYPENTLGDDISANALFARTRTIAIEVFELLTELTQTIGELVKEAARLEPPQSVWREMETGRIFLADPH